MKKTAVIMILTFLLTVSGGGQKIAALPVTAAQQQSISEHILQKPNYGDTLYSIGDSVFMGEYEQDNNLANGPEPIEWVIIRQHGSFAILLSKYCLDRSPYDSRERNVTWDSSDLKAWLNEEFYHSAFTKDERMSIIPYKFTGVDNPWTGRSGGNSINVKVFCLSVDEYNDLNKELAYGKPTKYAKAQGIETYNDMLCPYWLRTAGTTEEQNTFVWVDKANYGSLLLYGGGTPYTNSGIGIRPAIKVELKEDDSDIFGFNDTCCYYVSGQSLGNHWISNFHLDGTYSAYGVGSGGGIYTEGVYKFEGSRLVLDNADHVFEWNGSEFESVKDYQMQTGTGKHRLSLANDSEFADIRRKSISLGGGYTDRIKPKGGLMDGEYYANYTGSFIWNNKKYMCFDLVIREDAGPDSMGNRYYYHPTAMDITIEPSAECTFITELIGVSDRKYDSLEELYLDNELYRMTPVRITIKGGKIIKGEAIFIS